MFDINSENHVHTILTNSLRTTVKSHTQLRHRASLGNLYFKLGISPTSYLIYLDYHRAEEGPKKLHL